jgi:hypothetical protein
MKKFLMSAMALTAVLIVPDLASADEVADRTQAIRLCRAEVAAQTGLEPDSVHLDQARVRGRSIRVDLDIWRDGRLQNVRCDVRRGDAVEIVAITPALQTATAAR